MPKKAGQAAGRLGWNPQGGIFVGLSPAHRRTSVTLRLLFSCLLAGALLSPTLLRAQAVHHCVTHERTEALMAQDPFFRLQQESFERTSQSSLRGSQATGVTSGCGGSSNTYTIQVVVHVLHSEAAESLSVAQVQSQIDVLNEDFNRTNADAISTPAEFQGIAANSNIAFELASEDPDGFPTTGINYVAVSESEFYFSSTPSEDNTDDIHGNQLAWNRDRYLNIYVCDVQFHPNEGGGILLGYAQFPGGPATTDYVVINYLAFGRGPYTFLSGINLGRTCTHEVGHWLNLRHLWGDGTCSVDDGVSDTPLCSNDFYASLPGCGGPGNQCGQGNRMIQNYMDYSDDGCMNLFTNGQAARMRSALEQFRPTLDTLIEPAKAATITLYPNPTEDLLTVKASSENDLLVGVRFYDPMGNVFEDFVATGSEAEFDLSALKPGLYFVEVETQCLTERKKIQVQ